MRRSISPSLKGVLRGKRKLKVSEVPFRLEGKKKRERERERERERSKCARNECTWSCRSRILSLPCVVEKTKKKKKFLCQISPS
jgi:hypothetical protein